MKIIIPFIVLLTFIRCNNYEHKESHNKVYFNLEDSNPEGCLFRFLVDSMYTPGTQCGYKNINGEVIIPVGKYHYCFTDTFKTFAIVFDEHLTESVMVAIDRNEKILFDIYLFDNGPDWLEDGLFRIVRNGKIGYADKKGVIVIEPKYECADQFKAGIARVSLDCEQIKDNSSDHSARKSNSWFYIDKKGNKIKQHNSMGY